MSVLIASRLIVLLTKRLRNRGHMNSVVKSNVIKLSGLDFLIEVSGLGALTDRKPRGGRRR